MSGWVTFRMGERDLAGRLDEVLEVVRASGVEILVGTVPPVTGVLVLRGAPLPVVDVRTGAIGSDGDVLVLAGSGADVLCLAVDRVVAVLPADALREDPGPLTAGLPAYVTGVLRPPGDGAAPVLLVDLRALAALGRTGRKRAAPRRAGKAQT